MIPRSLRILANQAVRAAGGKTWKQRNARRNSLIDKEIDSRLSAAEKLELEALQAEAKRQIVVPPVDFRALEDSAREEGLLPPKIESD